ncbi:MAG: hypothetical protein RLZZ298_1745 [Pseudomonadota bacterium]|jgi:energy-coupling factor transporter ATP-binding protein EcfA2
MPYNSWTKIDNGREGLWDLDVWLGVIQIVSRHEGEPVYDEYASIYKELEERFPGKGWKKYDTDAAGAKQFRPLFRDYAKPWTNTATVRFDDQKFTLTNLGRRLVSGEIGPSEVFKKFLNDWSDGGERPFQILASAILAADQPLNLRDFYFGVMREYRLGDDIREKLIVARAETGGMEGTDERRLKLLLRILMYSGAISEVNSGYWIAWDKEQLRNLAGRSSVKGVVLTSDSLQKLPTVVSQDSLSAGLRIDGRQFGFVAAALLAKRFLILTGLSGSGKTKLAHAFAAWITESDAQYRVVAVGADWTTNENLLGYQDALRPEIYRKPTNGALDLMLRARDDCERPYFLILDEMNLSHVERYFADMLSAIESGESIALHSATENLPGGDGVTLTVPARLELPKNLFIVGTVNVDETTYMFSPKVLDRANVIEFRATAGQIGAFMDSPQRIRMEALAHKGAAYGTAFVAAASGDAPLLADLPVTIHENGAQCADELKVRLVEAFTALSPIGAEFGFRTAFEISRFVAFHAVLTGPGWKFSDALDAQVYQKLMPKLHGSERRLGPVLKALEAFCIAHECTTSLVKIRRMQDRLKDGFTSFAEA